MSEDVSLEELLKSHDGELKKLAEAAGSGNREKVADTAATLALSVATGNPLVGALAPLARKGIARAFGNSVDAALDRELAVLKLEEERKRFLGQIDEVVEALLGQALIQLVRSQHAVKDEVLQALGDDWRKFEAFREDFAKRVASAGETVTVDSMVVLEGGLGVHVGATTTKRVVLKQMKVVGAGSIGVKLD